MADQNPSPDRFIIVTRKPQIVLFFRQWLEQKGYGAAPVEEVQFAKGDEVEGKHVLGTLPIFVAACARTVSVVDIPGGTRDHEELTAEQMIERGAVVSTYEVRLIARERA